MQCYYRPEINTGIDLAFRYLSLPLFILTHIAVRYFNAENEAYKKANIAKKAFITAFFSAITTAIVGNALILLFNAWVGTHSPEVIEGVIQDKWVGRGSKGGTSYNIRFYSERLQRSIWFQVWPSKYDEYAIGQRITWELRIGSLGIVY